MKPVLTIGLIGLLAYAQASHTSVVSADQSAGQSAEQPSDPGITATRVIGEVVQVDLSAGRMIIKTESGNTVIALLDEKTTYLRVPPGETSIEKATDTTLQQIGAGDRVYVRGRVSEDKKYVPAQKLVVMAKADIEKKRESERAEWQRRGIAGVVTAADPQAKEITLQVSERGGAASVIVSAPDGVVFRRYAPDSVKFNDAKPSTFSELKAGDQLRASGQRSAEGNRFTAERVVSGSFRTVGGTVTSVSAETGEIKIAMLGSKKLFTVVINRDSSLKSIPLQVAKMIAQRAKVGATAPPAPPSQTDWAADNSADLADMLERLPVIDISGIKPGDTVAISSTVGADPSRLTAIILVTGLDAILNELQRSAPQRRQVNLNTGLPPGVLDIGIGQP